MTTMKAFSFSVLSSGAISSTMGPKAHPRKPAHFPRIDRNFSMLCPNSWVGENNVAISRAGEVTRASDGFELKRAWKRLGAPARIDPSAAPEGWKSGEFIKAV
jgi:hypothetical protein